MNISSTAIIRQRGQLTIPDSIRDALSWLKTDTVVAITPKSPDELVITPYKKSASDRVNWDEIWRKIKLTRSFKGKRGNLSRFIAEDRKHH